MPELRVQAQRRLPDLRLHLQQRPAGVRVLRRDRFTAVAEDRCGRPLEPRDMPGRPYEPFPVCGRRAGHRGQCLSRAAWQREIERARESKWRQKTAEKAGRGPEWARSS